jgi:hypothetical protein
LYHIVHDITDVSAPTVPVETTDAHPGASPVVLDVLASIDAKVLVVAN